MLKLKVAHVYSPAWKTTHTKPFSFSSTNIPIRNITSMGFGSMRPVWNLKYSRRSEYLFTWYLKSVDSVYSLYSWSYRGHRINEFRRKSSLYGTVWMGTGCHGSDSLHTSSPDGGNIPAALHNALIKALSWSLLRIYTFSAEYRVPTSFKYLRRK